MLSEGLFNLYRLMEMKSLDLVEDLFKRLS